MPLDTDLPPDGADERPIRVSIVDDDPFALRMLRSYLEGYSAGVWSHFRETIL